MKKMILLPLAIFFSLLAIAQTNSKIIENEEKIIYWFEMSIKYSEPNEDADISLIISKIGNELKTGTIKEFEKNVYEALKNYHICIGYYNTKPEAEEAKIIYDMMSSKDEPALSALKYSDQGFKSYTGNVYWYVLHPFEGKNQWHYVRKPGALASGSIEDFIIFLKENLIWRVFTVGPFISGETAEDSKRIFRLKNESFKKKKKYPFNFEGTWVSKPENDTMTIDIKKGFKTKITCSYMDEGSEIIGKSEYYNLIHPTIIKIGFEAIHKYFSLFLFLSDDRKSVRVKMIDRYNVTKEYWLTKQ